MPIFQDDFGGSGGTPPPAEPLPTTFLSRSPLDEHLLKRKVSEESIRTDLCEGPISESLEEESMVPIARLNSGFTFAPSGISNRDELIQRLKRGESPTWLPKRNLESLLLDQEHTPRKPILTTPNSSPLLPSPQLPESQRPQSAGAGLFQTGLQIERPRSALHSGDFTEDLRQRTTYNSELPQADPPLYIPGQAPWIATSPPRNFSRFQVDQRFQPVEESSLVDLSRNRAPSLSSSYSSSFVFKPPTSPLVQSESNEELDFASGINPIDISPPLQRNPRRHTLHSSHSINSGPTLSPSNRPLPHLRRDNTYPYQAHQPRRSLTSNASISSPQTPAFLNARRQSYTSDNSPLHHASMVGSYEESILRGRMSTNPSKPLDFVAQIGVLGLGKCKSSLRCPPHVTLPFPAVFYSYETTTHGRASSTEDGPSPYVGQIDLEHGLPSSEEARDSKRARLKTTSERNTGDEIGTTARPNPINNSEKDPRRIEKQKRRSTSPRAPPGGSYRIPEKGQLQIIIKNPNKTAVKLFLVPYDLAGMEPGTKTFIRQRSYSAGPIIDTALSSTPQNRIVDPLDRPILRYLVHLHICCPARGRFYLYNSIRVVFANRVPDGKEKLRNEISLPEPRFTAYKPGRNSSIGASLGAGAGANLAAEKAFRRRSSGFPLAPASRPYDAMDGITHTLQHEFSNGPVFPHGRIPIAAPVQPIPFMSYGLRTNNHEGDGLERITSPQSPSSNQSSELPSGSSGMSSFWGSDSSKPTGYSKLNKGDAGYGGNLFGGSTNGKQAVAEGLLAKKLRDLGVGTQDHQEFNGIN